MKKKINLGATAPIKPTASNRISNFRLDSHLPTCYGVYTMNYTMARVQVYLDPQDVDILDTIAEKVRIKRSQIIRDLTKTVALRYSQVAQLLTAKKSLKNPLLELGGIEVSKTGRASINVDEIYSQT